MKNHTSEKGAIPASILAVIAFALITVVGLWYISYVSKQNIDRIVNQNRAEMEKHVPVKK